MTDLTVRTAAVLGTLAAIGMLSLPGVATAAAAQGKIVCWKDTSGKVIGCGDKVPPEFQTSGTKELDSRGLTRKTTESDVEVAQRRARDEDAARVKAEDDRKMIIQKRQDTALLETYNSEQEIDLKRDRDLQVINLQVEQLNTALKSAAARYDDVRSRTEALEKNKRAVAPALKDDLVRAISDKERLEERIEAKQKEKEELRTRYSEYKKRYTDLRTGVSLVGQTPAAAKK
jgi:chromosome segregation ATPase